MGVSMGVTWPAARAFEVLTAADGALQLCGELDDPDVGRFREAVDAAIESEPELLVLDLSELTFLASAGVSELLRANSRHPALVLRGVRREVERVIEVAGLLPYFSIQ
jgi:anti-anti-sigma factor